MNYEANRGYFNGYDGYGSGFNFTYAYDSNIGQDGVPQSRNADPYAEEYPTNFTQHPRNYQVDAGSYGLGYSEANTKHWHHDTDIYGDTVSRQRPRSRTSSNRNNRSAGRPDRPTIQPEQIPVPSSTYLRLAEQPSVRLTDSTQTRKLLILDLNGTLLYREPRTKDGYDPYALNEPRPLRPTHTRPYMSSFKAFLFHPETRKWLDTMVWSSAQYPNVKDMISRYGTESHREGLVALWDRKFLGLSETQYRNKFQTTKNLAKPWALLPLSTFSGPTKMLSEAWDRLLSHSAHSTLLLDDSPLKARMQPYNHVCVPEYEGKFYARDVRIAEARDADAFSDDIAVAVERTVTSSSENVASAGVGKRKRSQSLSPQLLPRNHKKMKRLSPEYDADDLSQQHDHILLAVIGLLEALKHESNVAAWIKDNGLFASNRTELKAEPSPKRSSLDCMEHVDYTEESNPGEKDIFSNPRASPPGLTGKGLDIDLSTGLENPPVEHSAIESAVAQISKSQIPFQPLPSLWYQHPPARWYWVRRGVRVLKELGLEVIPGVEINLD
ncbi:hypothetical protein EV368DRAFT_46852 [Lentinula lateritia]|nr:hypothetical protein EV368DRAFT_46852 [Lentinula lateritia]